MVTTTTTDTSGFDLSLSEEQELVQRTARDFAREKVLPKAAGIDENKKIPRELIAEMGRLGFMGIDVPERYGGSGMDRLTYMLVVEEINRACASTGVVLCTHVSLGIEPILLFGSDAQKEKWLPSLAKGEKIACFALSEPASGSDAAAMRTSARRDGDVWALNGTKNFITNGLGADTAIVFASTDRTKGHHGISAFLVERGFPGFRLGKDEVKLGITCSGSVEMVFEDCRVPAENRLGEEGEGFKIAMNTLDGGRIGIAAQAVGIARAALEEATRYSRQRRAFGRSISEFQAIQFMLADMATEVDAARLLTHRAAWLKDRGSRYTREASQAKLFASEVAMRSAVKGIQIFGGYGYMNDYPVERYFRDAKITEIYEGTSEIQRLVIAGSLLKD